MLNVTEAGLRCHAARPRLNLVRVNLDRPPALPADQMVVVSDRRTATVQRLALGGTEHIQLTRIRQRL